MAGAAATFSALRWYVVRRTASHPAQPPHRTVVLEGICPGSSESSVLLDLRQCCLSLHWPEERLEHSSSLPADASDVSNFKLLQRPTTCARQHAAWRQR